MGDLLKNSFLDPLGELPTICKDEFEYDGNDCVINKEIHLLTDELFPRDIQLNGLELRSFSFSLWLKFHDIQKNINDLSISIIRSKNNKY